jgi:hypothetical protein
MAGLEWIRNGALDGRDSSAAIANQIGNGMR